MSETDQFWQYAKEALLSACYAKTDEDKRDMLDLARTWTQAALQQRRSFGRSQRPGLINGTHPSLLHLGGGSVHLARRNGFSLELTRAERGCKV